MATIHLLYEDQYKVNDSIHVVIPKVRDVLKNEDDYYSMVSLLTAMPIDYMVPLDDAGIDFTEINEFELFLIMFEGFRHGNTSMVFGDLDFSKFVISINNQNGLPILYDPENDIRIDRVIYNQIATVLRKIHHLEKNRKKPANKEAKDYMLERARLKMKRRKNRSEVSQLESLIVSMVNTEQYKYDFEGTKELSIYQFNESVRQVIHKVDYDNRMYGIYAGTIDPKGLSQDDLTWLSHK